MTASAPEARPSREVPSRRRVHLLPDPKATERGIVYRRGRERLLLAWNRVRRAFAAELASGDQAPRIVFELVVEETGPECVVCRIVCDGSAEAPFLARAILVGIGEPLACPCIRSLATDGVASRRTDDLEAFGESVLEAVRFG